MTDLIEENSRLKKENKQLLDLLTNLTEETKRNVDFWRSSYMILWRQANTYAKVELSPGEQTQGGRGV